MNGLGNFFFLLRLNKLRDVMKKLYLLVLIMFLFTLQLLSQDWPTAPEVWSKPVLLDSSFIKPFEVVASPCLNAAMDTMYLSFGNSCISRSVKLNGKWQKTGKFK